MKWNLRLETYRIFYVIRHVVQELVVDGKLRNPMGTSDDLALVTSQSGVLTKGRMEDPKTVVLR